MAARTVTGTVVLPGGTVPSHASVMIELIASTTGRAVGWVPSADLGVGGRRVLECDTAGAWSVDLQPNALIDPQNTYYRLTYTTSADTQWSATFLISVPDTAGPHRVEDILSEASASMPSNALSNHIGNTSGAHAASAISFSPTGSIAATNTQAAVAEVATDAAAALAAHEADTTGAHGIADTSALVTTSTVAELVRDTMSTALVAGTNISITVDDPGDTITIAAGSGLATDAEVTSAVSTHAAVTSGVHGISAFGATLVDDASAAAARTTLELGTLATLSTITSSEITDGTIVNADISAAAAIATSKIAGLAASATTDTTNAANITSGTLPNARLGAELQAIAGLTSAADRVPYFTGSGTAALATFTSAGRDLLDDADATAQRTTLGLGTIATQAASAVAITGGSITGITDLAVADGGTGASTAADARTNLGLGTLATLSTITSAEITDGTIVNADISAAAAIAGTKVDAATDSARGTVELATTTEANTGTDTTRAITAAGLAYVARRIESRRRWGLLNGGGDLGSTEGWVDGSSLVAPSPNSWDAAAGAFKFVLAFDNMASEPISVDNARDLIVTYEMNMARTADHVVVLQWFDVDGLRISQIHQRINPGSAQTTLAATLNPGDTTVTLTDATGWYNSTDALARNLALWPYVDGAGRSWSAYTYSRNTLTNGWASGGISGNVITLSTPWAGASWPSGSPVANMLNYDNVYTSIEVFPTITPATWYRVRSTVSRTSIPEYARFGRLQVFTHYAGAATSYARAFSVRPD